jgi:hypothetical protein
MNLRTKWVVAGSAIVLTAAIELSRLAWAAPLPVVLISQHTQTQGTDNADEDSSDVTEQQQLLRLQPQARVTLAQALQAAEADQRGRATSAELETENNSLVYTVDIGLKEVIVDAGNGQILATEDLSQPNSRVPQWRGSVRVSENPMGDEDGETQDDG